jgi:DeoR family transcriptional regulator, aga operon transcriptional repressor
MNRSASVTPIAAPLLPPQRRDRIVGFLRRSGAATLQQLSQALDVSPSTLRRDLDTLEAEGILDRTHGGALLRQQPYSTFEPDPQTAAVLSPREKRAIGRAAAAGLTPGQSVLFDSGSTVLEAARAVLERGIALTAATNDLAIAQLLGASPQVRVLVLGGQLRAGSHTLVGDAVIEGARGINADVLLMGAHAVTGGEVSETLPEVAAVKRAFLRAASSRWLLVDASKFRPRAFMTVCGITEFHQVVSDDALPRAEVDALRAADVALLQVSSSAARP